MAAAKPKKTYVDAILGPFVFSHVHLSSPDTEGQFADNKYKVDGVADPKSKAIAEVEATLKDVLKKVGLPAKGTNLPLKKQMEKVDGKKQETGKLFLRAKSNRAPLIVDASGKPIPKEALKKMKIGAGSEGRIEGYFTDYETTERVRNADGEVEVITIKGVSFTLTGIQLLKLVNGGGGSRFGAYEGYEGGFTYSGDDGDEDALDLSADDGDDRDAGDADGDEGGLDI
ncbi:ssDNA-binding protein [Novosphingobium panipatense]|uniref:DUF2815 family protein n=2 Tax=Novosphingobium panipatense TaxID=428991 RepID=A0ABY1QL79_9SPHN|nr:ssDNA-binding protein [Novosphingobium panipatense]SMP74144.1 Protein of unknown function [Novosphingobium panipatense]